MNISFQISHADVTNDDESTVKIPWSEIAVSAGMLSPSVSFRRKTPGAPASVCVGFHAAAVAHKLSQRQRWQKLDSSLKCPTFQRVLTYSSLYSLAALAAFAAPPLMRAAQGGQFIVGVWDTLAPETQPVLIVVLALWTFCALVFAAAPFFIVGPYLAFRFRNRAMTGMHVTRDVLVLFRSNGEDMVYPWTSLIAFSGDGRLVFDAGRESRVCVYLFNAPTWPLVLNRLKRTHKSAYVGRTDAQTLKLMIRALVVSALGAEILTPILLRSLGAQPPPPGVFLAAAAALFGLCVLQLLLHRRFRIR